MELKLCLIYYAGIPLFPLLIELYGIETPLSQVCKVSHCLLIELYGIETASFNCDYIQGTDF